MKIKVIYIYLILCLSSFQAVFSQDILQEANDAYSKQEYQKAIMLYEKVLKEKGSSPDLYYNLGNAYYKNKEYPRAILNYERSLLLSPGDADTRFNLELAKTKITDKIEPVGNFFLTIWIETVRDGLSSNSWAVIGIISFILFIAGAYLYFFTRRVVIKKLGFFLGLFLLFVSAVSNCFAFEQKDKMIDRNKAIVFAPTITVKSSPAESGTNLFVLHEGTKVSVLSKVAGWSEILLEDGNRGWMPSDKLEII